ncbi:MAG: hypothetical protein EON58_17110 [Alphaproteobacteria bacterium]|nr:MAG: hypothetical protein EON58_17110 [Alphaproteobacteria bacterium]
MSEIDRRGDLPAAVGAALLALAVFWLSYATATFAAKIIVGILWYSLVVWTAVHAICVLGCMALARFCSDKVFKTYLGPGPFVLFLGVGILSTVWILGGNYLGMGLLLDIVVQLVIVAAAYWWFGLRKPLPFRKSLSPTLQSLDKP